MRKRTLARECALQLLYQVDLTGDELDEAFKYFWQDQIPDEEVRSFTEKLVRGALRHLKVIDEILAKYAEHWELRRMAVLDRNILRLATYELLYLAGEIPPKVSINEAVTIAKKYSQEESGKFVNGILDKINHTEERLADQVLQDE
jgi:transcription antitermination factor NusB